MTVGTAAARDGIHPLVQLFHSNTVVLSDVQSQMRSHRVHKILNIFGRFIARCSGQHVHFIVVDTWLPQVKSAQICRIPRQLATPRGLHKWNAVCHPACWLPVPSSPLACHTLPSSRLFLAEGSVPKCGLLKLDGPLRSSQL